MSRASVTIRIGRVDPPSGRAGGLLQFTRPNFDYGALRSAATADNGSTLALGISCRFIEDSFTICMHPSSPRGPCRRGARVLEWPQRSLAAAETASPAEFTFS